MTKQSHSQTRMIIYIFVQSHKIFNITKQGRKKQALYVDDSIVWLEEVSNFLLKKKRETKIVIVPHIIFIFGYVAWTIVSLFIKILSYSFTFYKDAWYFSQINITVKIHCTESDLNLGLIHWPMQPIASWCSNSNNQSKRFWVINYTNMLHSKIIP